MSRLPPEVALTFARAIRSAIQEALGVSSSTAETVDAQTQINVTTGLRQCFETTLSLSASTFNERYSFAGRLSDEQLRSIYRFMPTASLVSATHVCRRWRATALGCPALWNEIRYASDVHYDDCDCHPDGGRRTSQGCKDPGSNNLDYVEAALNRSGNTLPIVLHVDIMATWSNDSDLKDLADALGPYTARLTELYFFSEDSEACPEFLEHFSELPALHTLSIRPWHKQYSPNGNGRFLLQPLDLPALQSLEVVGEQRGQEKLIAPGPLPSLSALSIRFTRTADILEFLDIAPNVRQLQLHAPTSLKAEPNSAYKKVRKRVRTLDLQVEEICSETEPVILSMFDSGSHAHLSFGYHSAKECTHPIAGTRIIGHLDRVVEFSISTYSISAFQWRLDFTARDPAGRERAVRFGFKPTASTIAEIWGHLPGPPDLPAVDAKLWELLSPPAHVLADVKKLHLTVPPSFDLASLPLASALVGIEEVKLADVAQELKSAVKRAASEALQAAAVTSQGMANVTHQRLTAELRACVEEVLLDLSSDFNAEATLPGRLWNELWCIVLSFLPTADLVRSTHVCRRWRNVALGCAHLWCQIEYESDIHYDNCDCHLAEIFFGHPRCGDGPGSSNLDAVKAFLSRSGSIQPISLRVDILGEYTSHDELGRLAGALKPHLTRLAALRFTSEDAEACAVFLRHFDCLPALETLHNSCERLGYSPDGCGRFLSRPLHLPELRTLEIKGSIYSEGLLPEHLPFLSSLYLPFTEIRDILEYLTISPALRQLRLEAPSYLRNEPQDALDRVRDLAASRALDVLIANISPHCEASIVALFDSAAHSKILLAYAEPEGLVLSNPTIEGLRILRHIDRIEELSIYRRPFAAGVQRLVISARSPAGKVRTLAIKTAGAKVTIRLGDLWQHISTPAHALLVDARLWQLLEFPAGILADVRKLSILVNPSTDLSTLIVPGPFTLLEDLRFTGQVKGKAPRLPATALMSFLHAASVPGVLKLLVLNRVEVEGDVSPLRSVIPTVLVQ
ncbi:hypothetical protein AURDEDRAFT_162291 [Auricularia subglabra TFB-10046 SS5]|nr:hypothetical protein AURDEDRAFT_162291 [Auricularia subglabra TFB-10046 SS5]